MKFKFFFIITIYLISIALLAQSEEKTCTEQSILKEKSDLKIAIVLGPKKSKLQFYSDAGDCPDKNKKECKKRQYLIAGDKILVSKKLGEFVCAFFRSQDGIATTGWVLSKKLNFLAQDKPPESEDWAKEWVSETSNFTIFYHKAVGSLIVEGGSSEEMEEGGQAVSLKIEAKPEGKNLVSEDGSCRVVFKLAGDFLLVTGTETCGTGTNLDGIYILVK